jgi:hypothetical protein
LPRALLPAYTLSQGRVEVRIMAVRRRYPGLTRREAMAGLSAACCTPGMAFAAGARRLGCHARRADADSQSGAYKASTGVKEYDAAVRSIVKEIETLLGHSTGARIMFVDENDAHFQPNGNVLVFGRALMDELRGSDFRLKLSCLVAHEICHAYQVADPYMDPVIDQRTARKSELMADAFAGLCLAMIVCKGRSIDADVIQRNRDAVEGAFQYFFSLGDTMLWNVDHHGTPEERMETIRMSYEMSFQSIRGLDEQGEILYDVLDAVRPGGLAVKE